VLETSERETLVKELATHWKTDNVILRWDVFDTEEDVKIVYEKIPGLKKPESYKKNIKLQKG